MEAPVERKRDKNKTKKSGSKPNLSYKTVESASCDVAVPSAVIENNFGADVILENSNQILDISNETSSDAQTSNSDYSMASQSCDRLCSTLTESLQEDIQSGEVSDETLVATRISNDADVSEEATSTEAVNDVNRIVESVPVEHDNDKVEHLYPSLPTVPSINELTLESTPTAPVLSNTDLNCTPSKVERTLEEAEIAEEAEEPEESIKPYTLSQILALYENRFLINKTKYIDEFLEAHCESRYRDHKLYKLLTAYQKSLLESKQCLLTVSSLKQSYEESKQSVWHLKKLTAEDWARCGDNSVVRASKLYSVAIYDADASRTVLANLAKLRDCIRERYNNLIYHAEIQSRQIEQCVHTVLQPFKHIQRNAPVQPGLFPVDENAVQELRFCISVLFCFARRPVSQECADDFRFKVRSWLSLLVAYFQRCASLADHYFLLNHVLRCPPGISQWAIEFVQVPRPPPRSALCDWSETKISHPFVDYAILVLSTVLSEIRDREGFLRHAKLIAQDSGSDEGFANGDASSPSWVVVDSDGEEDQDPTHRWYNWLESDVIDLINQVPIADIFRYILRIATGENDDEDYDASRTTEGDMLRLIAIATQLITIFHQGLQRFHLVRYRQLTKRLSRLIRHTVQYVSDHWLMFREVHQEAEDAVMRSRIQVEFDEFFLRSANSIFSSERLGAWQFMAVLPYSSVSDRMMWQLLWMLHNGYQDVPIIALTRTQICQQLQDGMTKLLFQERLAKMEPAEVLYLLTSFNNMAVSRRQSSRLFIDTVALEIFTITYLNVELRDKESKTGRELLSALCTKHSFVISTLLRATYDNMTSIGSMCLYLFSELPLQLWSPLECDLKYLRELIVKNPLQSHQNHFARLVLQKLNYGFNVSKRELFLDVTIHHAVAVMLLEAFRVHCVPQSQMGFVYRQVKYFSDFLSATKVSATPDGFNDWVWEMLYQLRLHAFDICHPAQVQLILDEDPPIGIAPSLENSLSFAPVAQSVISSLPLSIYIALMCTTKGHYVDDMLSSGFDMLHSLAAQGYHKAAVEVLCRVLPLFYQKRDLLLANKKFLATIQILLQINVEVPNEILKHIGNIIRKQVEQVAVFPSCNVLTILELWLQVLYNLPDMSMKKGALHQKVKGREALMYLLDLIVQIAYSESVECVESVVQLFYQFLQESQPVSIGSGSMMKSMLQYVTWSSGDTWPLLVPLPFVAQYAWFAWAGLMAESQLQCNVEAWTNLLKEMSISAMMPTDAAMKKISTYLKVVPPHMDLLLLYRWAQQALETDMNHPALPLIWQQFFIHYLQRPPIPERGSVGRRFFETQPYFALIKRMKRSLQDLSENFLKRHSEIVLSSSQRPNAAEDVKNGSVETLNRLQEAGEMFGKIHQFYRTLFLWLEEPRLHESNIRLLLLPPQYNADLLRSVLQEDKKPWYEYVSVSILNEYINALHAKPRTPSLRCEDVGPSEKIVERLTSYEESKAPVQLSLIQPVFPLITLQDFQSWEQIDAVLVQQLTILAEHARVSNAQFNRIAHLDNSFDTALTVLYTDVDRQITMYQACHLGPKCKQHGEIRLKYMEAELNAEAKQEMDNNRVEWQSILDNLMQPPPNAVCVAAAQTEAIVNIVCTQNVGDTLGAKMFYRMLEHMNMDTLNYPATTEFLTDCLKHLGNKFILGNQSQCVALACIILERPHIVGYAAPYFDPMVVEPAVLSEVYMLIASSILPDIYDAIFVLLTKLDLRKYLTMFKTLPQERRCMIETLAKALQAIKRFSVPQAAPVLEAYEGHLKVFAEFNYPDHYGDILSFLLEAVTTLSIPESCYWTFLKSLQCDFDLGDDIPWKDTCDNFQRNATRVSPLDISQALETSNYLQTFFTKLRSESPLLKRHGLFGHVNDIVKPLALLHGITAHCLIWQKTKCHQSTDLNELLEEIFKLFSPWIQPINEKGVLYLPWNPGEAGNARIMLEVFAASISYCQTTCSPRGVDVISSIWQHYFTSYVWNGTKSYICQLYCSIVSHLPWQSFVPTLSDLKLMVELLSPKYSEHMSFLVAVFLKVNWKHVIELRLVFPAQGNDALICVAELLVKLAWEPTVLQSGQVKHLVTDLQEFDWICLPDSLVNTLANVFSLSCIPGSVIVPTESTSSDRPIHEFLKTICCVFPGQEGSFSYIEKQIIYFKTIAKLTKKCSESSTGLVRKYPQEVRNLMPMLMAICSGVISARDMNYFHHAVSLQSEILTVMNLVENSEWLVELTAGLLEWLSEKCPCHLLLPCLVANAKTVVDMNLLASITESCIFAYCSSESELLSADGGWANVVSTILFPELTLDEFLTATMKQSAHLTQYAYVLYKLPQCNSLDHEVALLNKLLDWVLHSCPQDEETEAKLLLLWEKLLFLVIRQLDFGGDQRNVYKVLEKFSCCLGMLGEDKLNGGGLLGVIGWGRKSTVSINFRYCCRVMNAYVASLVGEEGAVVQTSEHCRRPSSHQATQALSKLKAMLGNKTYVSLQGKVNEALSLIANSQPGIRDYAMVIRMLINFFYADRAYLRTLFFGAI